ncbi:hypothetical protein [Rhodoplanes azumiensis]|uniref:Uncharacterized protein n=1 Tax=Rhodoplanes azumiensis TaxID=1897628 RepID=A0ABW5AIY8_9BRAD
MRILVVTHHFFEPAEDPAATFFASRIDPVARIAAVNAMLVAFHRHFGPRRHAENAAAGFPGDSGERVLDIVVLQVPGKGIMEHVGIDPSTYTLEEWDGPPMQLGFETQRVIRERLGQYDFYAVVEDDMLVHDPLFFDKLAWFEREFGPERLLLPLRYEMAQSGTPALVAAWPVIPVDSLYAFGMRRASAPERLAGRFHGREQGFAPPRNPHVGGFFVSDAQLRRWVDTPWFYDRDASFAGPLESAMTLALCRAFDVYQPAAPDPFFLSIEHFGTRYARGFAPPGVTYGDPPLLSLARRAAAGANEVGLGDLLAVSDRELNKLMNERDTLLGELSALQRSRSKLFKTLLRTLWRKA